MTASAYRPRNAGHDYYGRGTYLITLVVSGREQLLSHFSARVGNAKLTSGKVLTLTPLGEVVEQTWKRIPKAQAAHVGSVLVQCHRKHPVTRQPYEETADYASEHRKWESAILEESDDKMTHRRRQETL